jgi:hypothetical protein
MPQEPREVRRFGLGPRNLFQRDPISGEWQRIIHEGNRDGPIVDLTPRAQRRRIQFEALQERRKGLAKYGWAIFLTFAAFAGAAVYVVHALHVAQAAGPEARQNANREFDYLLVFGVFAVLFALLMFKEFLKFLGLEFLYQIGWQHWIKGPKVLDPEPVRRDRSAADDEKVLGDAREATDAEVKVAARGGVRSSRLQGRKM